ncbi:hypothetical protein ACFL6N_01695 [Thermodesulfobacteriota bacterium]
MKKTASFDFKGLNTYSIHDRFSKVSVDDFARPLKQGSTIKEFLASLPDLLLGREFPELVEKLTTIHRNGKPILAGIGAHVIKVGLNPILIDLMERSILSGLAMNGACVVHDVELAMVGSTSEDVDQVIGSGAFGAARETGDAVNAAISHAYKNGMGLGEAVGQYLNNGEFEFNRLSLLATAHRLGIPVTVHVAIGTDIVHIHPSADGAAIGAATHSDFKKFCSLVADLDGGAYLNIGSAVLLPEVFLKALTAVRNLGHRVENLVTANFDFIRHYRTMTNVVNRPTAEGGKGYHITGHHEIMIPLLACALLEKLGDEAE